jgi:ribonuclease BN (tRNA processing enzyme)
MQDAARVAKEAGCTQLIATHYSSRYDGRQVKQIAEDARSIFENIVSGRDLLEIEI